MNSFRLDRSWQVLLFLFLLISGLYFAKPILAPLCFALLFSLLFMPLCRRLDAFGIPRGLSIVICILLFLAIVAGIIFLITWQVKDLVSDLTGIQNKLSQFMDDIKNYISVHFGISKGKQEQMMKVDNPDTLVKSIGGALMNTLLDFILMLVYVFFLMFYRRHFRKFILKLIPKSETAHAEDAISEIEKVSQHYLTGMGLMIASLWVMYGIGFSIIGLKNALFFAILCGLFEIVPFVGNLVGNILAATMAITQGGGTSMVIAVLITYSSIQFIQSYIIQPLVVGGEVNINPFFTIFGLILGDLIWGITGMVLVLPMLAIAKIIFDHVDALKPYGFLLGNPPKKQSKIKKRVEGWAEKKRVKRKKPAIAK